MTQDANIERLIAQLEAQTDSNMQLADAITKLAESTMMLVQALITDEDVENPMGHLGTL